MDAEQRRRDLLSIESYLKKRAIADNEVYDSVLADYVMEATASLRSKWSAEKSKPFGQKTCLLLRLFSSQVTTYSKIAVHIRGTKSLSKTRMCIFPAVDQDRRERELREYTEHVCGILKLERAEKKTILDKEWEAEQQQEHAHRMQLLR